VLVPIRLSNPRRQYLELHDEIDAAFAAVVDRGVFTPDREVEAFEVEFSGWLGVDFAVGVASGSAALFLAMRALGVGPDDEVATTANLDISAVAPISQLGAEPLWIEIDPATHTMSPKDLEQKITTRTRAVVVVHCHGTPAAMDDVVRIARRRGLAVVEDATPAPGAFVGSRRVGALGDVGCFSLAPTKPLGALGNSGVVVTGDAEVAERVRVHANYGFAMDSVAEIRSGMPGATFRYVEAGVNATMDELQAAVLRVKLRHIDAWADRRREHAESYRSSLRSLEGLTLPGPHAGTTPAPRAFVVEHDHRDQIMERLHADGVQSALNYYPALHLQAPYGFPEAVGTLPVTERVVRDLLCIPVGPELSPDEVAHVATATRSAVLSVSGRRGS
jgi:dTDP-4-amino-4,6-dideoxygalactose transaminase